MADPTTPAIPSYVPPATPWTGDGGAEPAKGKIAPDRKVWINALITTAIAYVVGTIHHFTGFDLNVLNPILGTVFPGADITILLSVAIGSAVAQYVPPSVQDGVAWMTEQMVRAANASKRVPFHAMIVNEHAGELAAKNDIEAGVIPPDIVAEHDAPT